MSVRAWMLATASSMVMFQEAAMRRTTVESLIEPPETAPSPASRLWNCAASLWRWHSEISTRRRTERDDPPGRDRPMVRTRSVAKKASLGMPMS